MKICITFFYRTSLKIKCYAEWHPFVRNNDNSSNVMTKYTNNYNINVNQCIPSEFSPFHAYFKLN